MNADQLFTGSKEFFPCYTRLLIGNSGSPPGSWVPPNLVASPCLPVKTQIPAAAICGSPVDK